MSVFSNARKAKLKEDILNVENWVPFAWVISISHDTFNGKDYPLHVQLDNRTQTNGPVYVEQLKSFDFHQRKWQFVETTPVDLFEEIQKKVQLVIK